MKRLITFMFVVILATCCFKGFSQNIGIKAGLNLSKMLDKDNDGTYSDDFKLKPGYHIGAVIEFPLGPVAVEPGVLLSTKGYKYEGSDEEGGVISTSKISSNPVYIDVPVNLKYGFDARSAKISIVAGPNFAFGIAGKYKQEIEWGGERDTKEQDIKWGNGDEDDAKPFDFGVNFGAAVEFNSIELSVIYNLGLTNISPTTDNGATMKNRVLGISVAYRLGR